MYGIYLHTPYCVQKCPYCDFATVAVADPPVEAFVAALVAEIRDWPDRAIREDLGDPGRLASRPASTIYLGGGTPSLLPATAVGDILGALDQVFGISPEAEITMEVNPGTENAGRFAGYRAAGVNRLSIGVQSLDDAHLASLGRIHDAADARRSVGVAREAGFDNVSIDLIFALPGMDSPAWETTLEAALALKPDHVSAYNLTVEPATPLAGWVKQGRVVLPDEDTAADMYETTVAQLSASGLPRYEISNFAPAERISRHNSLYWRYEDYLAFGPSAHAFLRRGDGSGVRWWNDRNPERYLAAAGQPVLGGRDEVRGRRAMGEYVFLALRTADGVRRPAFQHEFGRDLDDVFGDTLVRHERLGLLDVDAQGARLTSRGFLVAETVFADFM